MSSTLTHSAIFAAGLLIGAGSIALSTLRQPSSSSSPKPNLSTTSNDPTTKNDQRFNLKDSNHPSNVQENPHSVFQNFHDLNSNKNNNNQHFFSNDNGNGNGGFKPTMSYNNTSKVGEFLKFGHPGPVNDFFTREAYAIGYDRRMRNPAWVAEHLTKENLRPSNPKDGNDNDKNNSPDRSHSSFHEDQALPEQFRSKLSDYFRSGYDRGHMAPAADAKRSQKAMDETFILSNIAPQVGEGFNRDYWAHLENYVRQLTNSFRDVYVFTVPLYLPKYDPLTKKNLVTYEVIGNPPNVAVPTHFAKVIYGIGGVTDPQNLGSISSFVLPNSKISNSKPLREFLVPIEDVERGSGLQLFSESVKKVSGKRNVCESVGCELVIRNFDNFNKQNKKN